MLMGYELSIIENLVNFSIYRYTERKNLFEKKLSNIL